VIDFAIDHESLGPGADHAKDRLDLVVDRAGLIELTGDRFLADPMPASDRCFA